MFIVKIFIDGDMVAEAPGTGLLSDDWAGKVGIGKHEDISYVLKNN